MRPLFLIPATAILAACGSAPLNVKVIESDSSKLLVVDEADVTETRDLKLSEVADDFRIVRFDNRDEAFFKPGLPVFSDNYIAAGNDPVKLFTREGKYISDVGSIGNGPGEYNIGVYDVLIDEEADRIYVMDFNRSINSYDLKGNFIAKIPFPAGINKGKLFKHPDGTMSVVHLCFKEDSYPFVAANFNPAMNPGDTIRYVFAPQLSCNMVNAEGYTDGFNNEVWSYRCDGENAFHTTFNDTLYSYNYRTDAVDAKFVLDMKPERKDGGFFVYQPTPAYIFANIVGGSNRGTILVDKQNMQAFRLGKRVNDYFFDLDNMGWNFRDGYIFDIYEPLELIDRLQEAIDEEKVSDEHLAPLREFMGSLKENDNNIMLVTRLRSSAAQQ